MKASLFRFLCLVGLCLWGIVPVMAQETPTPEMPDTQEQSSLMDKAIDSLPAGTVTVREFIDGGGVILYLILALAFFTIILGIYLFLTVTPRIEAPSKLLKQIANQIRAGEFHEAKKLCNGRHELMAKVLYSGLRVADQERYIIQEAMESEGERGATRLWQRVSYMNNVGAIAPLLGLLGTVWGMIGAFNSIAYDHSQIKGVSMAANVSEAMITTAAGLLLAIPAMLLYFYLRGRVINVLALIESQASEFVELIIKYRDDKS